MARSRTINPRMPARNRTQASGDTLMSSPGTPLAASRSIARSLYHQNAAKRRRLWPSMDPSNAFDFPLADLTPGQQGALDAALQRENIGHVWSGATLQVDVAYEARVSTLIDQARGGVLPSAPTP